MNSQELLEYVRRAKDLEIGVYEAQQIQDKFYESARAYKPRKPVEPNYESEVCPMPPEEVVERSSGSKIGDFCIVGAFLGFGIWLMAIHWYVFGILLLLLGIVLGKCAASSIQINEEKYTKYVADLQEYQNRISWYNQSIDGIIRRNQAKRDDYTKSLLAFSEQVADHVKRSKTEIDEVINAKLDLQAALRNLYEEGVIYPKYQNLVAVSTIYEYLASGRCDRLEGPNGAYNLYEMELRQNIVIGQLSAITEHLEQIKENQYTLYYEIQSANNNSASMLSSIGDDVKFSAYQNAAIAKNVETMRYISMMKNVWNGKGF